MKHGSHVETGENYNKGVAQWRRGSNGSLSERLHSAVLSVTAQQESSVTRMLLLI